MTNITLNGRQLKFLTISDFLNNLHAKNVLLLSSRDLRKTPLLFGEDNYMSTFVSELNARAVPITFLLVDRKKGKRELLTNIDSFTNNETVVILHNVSPFYVLKVKLNKKIKVVMPIYFLNNRTCSFLHNLNNRFGPIFWQLFVHEYLFASSEVAKGLKKAGLIRTISIVSPQYT